MSSEYKLAGKEGISQGKIYGMEDLWEDLQEELKQRHQGERTVVLV